ncbi:CLUMA_CG006562, isoform A [Clunio marinus]|uniref:m7GpppN-mRNA hydrolase n=1 Tax=Clunio marinus TaxID=568069 RepID=A0A1J1HY77_9DIPT|nr:CLUMA_CG006562, isoform A [Clunio marinus]
MSQIPSNMRKVPVHILDDLSSKFLINLPDGEKSDLIRLFFQIELAHWFFLDFYCTQEENSVYSCGIKQFALTIFEHIPFLNHHIVDLNTILEQWRSYKMSVPTYGTILLTPDMKHCLLVQSFFAKNSWSFPKGKVNENEDPVKCAIREVYEETGFDCSNLINPNDFVEGQTSNYQYTRLYIVKNVPIDTKFCPRTRNEIKDCSWFAIDQLPNNRNDDGYIKDQRKIRANSFFMILPFISKLKHWIMNERGSYGHNKKKHQGQRNGNKKNLIFTKQPSSPFFQSNVDHQFRNGKQRNKSTSDVIDVFKNGNGNNTYYNDHLKLQPRTSTPINSPFAQSSSSAFRPTNSEKNGKFNKKSKGNGKINQLQSQNRNEKKVFNDIKENIQPIVNVKPFAMDMPECWKNFKFDHQKLFSIL